MTNRIGYFREGTRASASHLNQLVDAANLVHAIIGDGLVTVNRGEGGATIGLNLGLLKARLGQTEPFFIAKITGNATDSTNRWKYAWSEVRLTAAGYGNWAVFTGSRTGTTSTDPARNFLEDMNAASGVQGNGVTVANLDTADYTFTIQAVPTNALVVMLPIRESTNNTLTYWFFPIPNGVDGTCD